MCDFKIDALTDRDVDHFDAGTCDRDGRHTVVGEKANITMKVLQINQGGIWIFQAIFVADPGNERIGVRKAPLL